MINNILNSFKNFIKNHFNLTAFLFFVAVIFCLYGNNLHFGWTFYDDDVLILDKQDYLSFSNIKNILTDTVFGQEHDKFCRPVLNLTFLFEKYLYGTNPAGYHFTNILLHLLSVFSIFLFLSLLYDKKKTFILCMFFAVHPSLVQAVSWISGRNDSLLTLFVFLSFYFLAVKILKASAKAFYFFHLLFFIFAVFTKETAVILPLFYLLFQLLNFSTAGSFNSSFNHLKIQPKKIFTAFIPYIIIIVLYLFYRSYVLSYQSYSVPLSLFIKSFFVSLPALTKYIANIFFPVKLSVFPAIMNTDYIICAASVLFFILFMLKFKKTGYDLKKVLFGFVWFFAFLLPTFIMPNNQFYDHRIYLSLAGILISLSEIIKNYNAKNFLKYERIIFLAVTIMFFIMFYFTAFFHGQKFADRETFWLNALMDAPQSDVANSVVAGILAERGRYKEAEDRYFKAISLNKYSKHYVNLAVMYIRTGRIDDAEKALLNALELNDYNPMIYYNLAQIYKYKGDIEKAAVMRDIYIKTFNDMNKFEKAGDIKL